MSQSTRVTDGQTDERTDEITAPKTALASLYRAVKWNSWLSVVIFILPSLVSFQLAATVAADGDNNVPQR